MNQHFVYAVLTEEGEGIVRAKIGHSSRIGARLSSIQTSCALPVGLWLLLEVPSRKTAKAIESRLHHEFRKRRTHGEWFAFVGEEGKAVFNGTCRLTFLYELGPGFWWMKLSPKKYREFIRPYQLRAVKERKKTMHREAAWRELRNEARSAMIK